MNKSIPYVKIILLTLLCVIVGSTLAFVQHATEFITRAAISTSNTPIFYENVLAQRVLLGASLIEMVKPTEEQELDLFNLWDITSMGDDVSSGVGKSYLTSVRQETQRLREKAGITDEDFTLAKKEIDVGTNAEQSVIRKKVLSLLLRYQQDLVIQNARIYHLYVLAYPDITKGVE